jgi:hypothetical protein
VIPWFVWVAVLAVSAAVLGVQWDIAWHRSIGRDTLWSPPHLAIYLGGVLSGLYAGCLILSTTFARSPAAQAARAAAVRIWGFYGPLGAFIAAWGGIAMVASAPFDDWWHNAYGLDVKILSPPHVVLAAGLAAIQIGALILIAGCMNRATGRSAALLRLLFLYVGGFLLVAAMTFELERTGRVVQHSGTFYRWIAFTGPLFLIGVGRAAGHRYGATVVAGVYSAVMLLLLWLFPLVPATPKLGPVYYPVTHLVPAGFPLLYVVPALAIDLVAPRIRALSAWRQSLILGLLFLGVFMAVQWPFASFLLSSGSRNWFFGSHYFGYNSRRFWSDVRHQFFDLDGSRQVFVTQLAWAVGGAVATTRLSLAFLGFLQAVKR